ncbi:hypothetical protein P9112_004730 [Eukaryota sp. TZLM1-RC]
MPDSIEPPLKQPRSDGATNLSEYSLDESDISSLNLPYCRFASCTNDRPSTKLSPVEHSSLRIASTPATSITCSPVTEMPLQPKLLSHISSKLPELSNDETTIINSLFNYSDVLYTSRSHVGKLEDPLLYGTLLHITNHILKLQARIEAHNLKIKQELPGPFPDQGFTRPSVLILCPFRSHVYKMVNYLFEIFPNIKEIGNKKRFLEEFGALGTDDGYGDVMEKKPEDWNQIFYGNVDDCFVLPVSFAFKQIKLFSSFIKADVIFASPLGLKMIIKKEGDFSFLSSLSMVFVDAVDVIFHQNWEHLTSILGQVNQIPKKLSETTDISRLWPVFQDGKPHVARQTILYSHLNFPLLMNLFKKSSNMNGKVSFSKEPNAIISKLNNGGSQTFLRISNCSRANEIDNRFKILLSTVLPRLLVQKKRIVIFVSDYLTFTLAKQRLKKEQLHFYPICEYDKKSTIDRARTYFAKDQEGVILLLSGRFYFYQRLKIINSHHIVFFDLPYYPIHYPFLINGSSENSSTTIFSKFDGYFLENIVGSREAVSMINSDQTTFIVQ